jgi:hypothetical protein
VKASDELMAQLDASASSKTPPVHETVQVVEDPAKLVDCIDKIKHNSGARVQVLGFSFDAALACVQVCVGVLACVGVGVRAC